LRRDAEEIFNWCKELATQKRALEAVTANCRDSNKRFGQEIEAFAKALADLEPGLREIKQFLQSHEGQLDTIGPSIGLSIITPAIREDASTREHRFNMAAGRLARMRHILHLETSIMQFYQQYIRWADRAKRLTQQTHDNIVDAWMAEVFRLEILRVVHRIELNLWEHRRYSDRLARALM
jgi:hypothetical protein